MAVKWVALHQMREAAGLEVLLVDAWQVKHVPVRKSDVQDCQWLQQLHTYGLLRAAFRPEDAICRLRTLQRHRKGLVECAAMWMRAPAKGAHADEPALASRAHRPSTTLLHVCERAGGGGYSGGMQWNAKQWRRSTQRFKAFMVPLVASLGRSEQRAAATSYVQGLLMPGQRKSIEPMAARLGVPSQRLQQFVADSPWDENDLWGVIRRRVLPHLEPIEAWIVDETGWLKQGRHSVGVARQYCGAVGKRANCQVSVELVVSDGEVAAPVGGRLYLPQSWLDDPARCAKAGVPPEVAFATKPQIALALIEQALAAGVAPAPVLADAAYGNGFGFRQRLRQLGLEFFLQVTPQEHSGWTEEVPTVLNGKYRTVEEATAQRARTLLEIAQALPAEAWQPCRWRAANGQRQHTRIAWQEVYLARGLKEPQGHL